jgi:hypothetical protein
MVLARFAGSGLPSSETSPEQKAPWALRIAVPVAGERERPSWKPSDLRKRVGRQRASREQARAGKWRLHSALPDALQVPGGLVKGAGLSSRYVHELATEGVRAERIGVTPSQQCGSHGSWRWLVSGFLVGESRSGPDLLKLGWRGARKGGHVTGCAVRRGLHPIGHTASTGFEAICCCARGSNWSQKSAAALGGASRKRATQGTPAMEGALDRGSAPPLTRRRAEAVLVLPLSVGSQIP